MIVFLHEFDYVNIQRTCSIFCLCLNIMPLYIFILYNHTYIIINACERPHADKMQYRVQLVQWIINNRRTYYIIH